MMKKQQLIFALNKLPDGTIELTITIPWPRVKESYQKTLEKLAKEVTIKGFRKGKAPLKKAEEKIDKITIHQEVLKTLIPQVYLEAIKEQNITPIVSPQIKVTALKEEQDWQIIATTCGRPSVQLKNYRQAVRQALAAEKIWLPGNAKTQKKSKNAKGNKLEKIFNALLTTAEVKIPAILIEDETNQMLSRLIDQTNQLGLTVEQYLASSGKTKEQLRQEYQVRAEQTLKLELILATIADEEKITVTEAEIETMVKTAPLRAPAQRVYITQLLRKRKVIDKLMKL